MAQSPMQVNTPSLRHFDFCELELIERIGRGNFSVYKAIVDGEEIAVKEMDCDKLNEIPREVEIHNSLTFHPNIVPLLGCAHSTDGFTIYICTQLADKSLYHHLHIEKQQPSLEQSTKWALQIARGMHHLHQHDLAHRDLKSANVLLFEKDDTVKLCDFGSARYLQHTTSKTKAVGTYRWMAPEFQDKATTKINKRCDVFSYGMVLYEIMSHELPFPDLDDAHIIMKIRDGARPPISSELPLYTQKLIEMCWEHSPYRRPTFQTILQVCSLLVHI